MISKKLLSEVLEEDVSDVGMNKGANTLIYILSDKNHYGEDINIYELAHKCKEWALSYPYILETRLHADCCTVNIEKEGVYIFTVQDDTEPGAIFKACEFILKETKIKTQHLSPTEYLFGHPREHYKNLDDLCNRRLQDARELLANLYADITYDPAKQDQVQKDLRLRIRKVSDAIEVWEKIAEDEE